MNTYRLGWKTPVELWLELDLMSGNLVTRLGCATDASGLYMLALTPSDLMGRSLGRACRAHLHAGTPTIKPLGGDASGLVQRADEEDVHYAWRIAAMMSRFAADAS